MSDYAQHIASEDSSADFTPTPNSAQAQLINNIEQVASMVEYTVTQLPAYPDEDVLLIRSKARLLGRACWLVESSCDAELLSRGQAKRGILDTDEKGIMALAKAEAKRAQCHPNTIRVNAKLFRTFLAPGQITNVKQLLSQVDEKSFYVEALSAADPIFAIERIAEEKQKDPNFSVRDARKLLSAKADEREIIAKPEEEYVPDSNFIADTETLIVALNSHKTKWPQSAPYCDAWVRDARADLKRSPNDTKTIVLSAVAAYCSAIEEIASETRLSTRIVEQALEELVVEGVVLKTMQGGREGRASNHKKALFFTAETFDKLVDEDDDA